MFQICILLKSELLHWNISYNHWNYTTQKEAIWSILSELVKKSTSYSKLNFQHVVHCHSSSNTCSHAQEVVWRSEKVWRSNSPVSLIYSKENNASLSYPSHNPIILQLTSFQWCDDQNCTQCWNYDPRNKVYNSHIIFLGLYFNASANKRENPVYPC